MQVKKKNKGEFDDSGHFAVFEDIHQYKYTTFVLWILVIFKILKVNSVFHLTHAKMKALRKILFTFSVAGACLLWSCQEEDVDLQLNNALHDFARSTGELSNTNNNTEAENIDYNVYRDRSGYGLRQ